MIVVDWGTTNLRAYLCREDGSITARVERPHGIKTVAAGQYQEILQQVLCELDAIDEPVYICGMAGARGGWVEAPYCRTPVSMTELQAGLIPLPAPSQGVLVPGIKTSADDGTLDVIRGEEIQVFGALRSLGQKDVLICLPGTHSKWVSVKNHRIVGFMTFMTGDIFAGLGGTILNCHSEDDFFQQAFEGGITASKQTRGGLLHQLFTARTKMLAGDLDEEQISSFVSGLLIGHELSEAERFCADAGEVVIIGSDKLSQRYRFALEERSVKVELINSDIATCSGVAALHRLLHEESENAEF